MYDAWTNYCANGGHMVWCDALILTPTGKTFLRCNRDDGKHIGETAKDSGEVGDDMVLAQSNQANRNKAQELNRLRQQKFRKKMAEQMKIKMHKRQRKQDDDNHLDEDEDEDEDEDSDEDETDEDESSSSMKVMSKSVADIAKSLSSTIDSGIDNKKIQAATALQHNPDLTIAKKATDYLLSILE
jgi:hypothetical protein